MAEKYIKLSDAKKAIEDYRSELTMSKYGSLEACMDAKFAVTGVMKELDYIPAVDVIPKSEVVKIFEEIEKLIVKTNGMWLWQWDLDKLAELKKKYTEGIDKNENET